MKVSNNRVNQREYHFSSVSIGMENRENALTNLPIRFSIGFFVMIRTQK